MPEGGARRGGPPPQQPTALEVGRTSDETMPVDEADQHPEPAAQARPTPADDRFVVPWALPDG